MPIAASSLFPLARPGYRPTIDGDNGGFWVGLGERFAHGPESWGERKALLRECPAGVGDDGLGSVVGLHEKSRPMSGYNLMMAASAPTHRAAIVPIRIVSFMESFSSSDCR